LLKGEGMVKLVCGLVDGNPVRASLLAFDACMADGDWLKT
jgi:hypothetical protein